MLNVRSPIAGDVAPCSGSGCSCTRTFVHSIVFPNLHVEVPHDGSVTTESTFQVLKACFHHWSSCPLSGVNAGIRDRLIQMASDMNDLGLFDNMPICLTHMQLDYDNIFVDRHAHGDSPIISAITDWDTATFAPMFMVCVPPSWLWMRAENNETFSRAVIDGPTSPEARELKQLFEDAAGPDYMRFAYEPMYDWARLLVELAMDYHFHKVGRVNVVETILRNWESHCRQWNLDLTCYIREGTLN
ncbi:uncharacterized protein F4822DRAFT_192411 [Hypoxylon trugodes]|uniref:uncharacterized protein n=1 Tax=Hypoxylon trugodes TaxID=326681 RepID=UPI00218FC72C|nr:uncharacterized protein F4822DRAFT_192411 [Hypoxylon trugodes]KAI1391653.1 hypothetical protein F4822DRAFT_192411 [Hypoxylon trugodes]